MSIICITGPFSSGKSYVIRCLCEKGYTCLRADDIVSSLYQEEEVISVLDKVMSSFFFPFSRAECKLSVQNFLLKYPDKITLVEFIVHKYVREKIDLFIYNNRHKVSFIEVPKTYTPFNYPFTAYVQVNYFFFFRFFRSLKKRGIKKTVFLCRIQNRGTDVTYSAPLLKIQGSLSSDDIMSKIEDFIQCVI